MESMFYAVYPVYPCRKNSNKDGQDAQDIIKNISKELDIESYRMASLFYPVYPVYPVKKDIKQGWAGCTGYGLNLCDLCVLCGK